MILRILLIAAVCQLITACGNEGTSNKNATPDYTDLSGNSGQFSDHHGKWIVINYWATWCKPCIEEIPELNDFANENADNAIVYGVDFDNAQGEKLLESSNKLGIEFPVLINDPSKVLGIEKPYALPTTFVFNPEGKLHQTLLGPQTKQSLSQSLVVTKES